MDFNCRDGWLYAILFGAKTVIFIEEEEASVENLQGLKASVERVFSRAKKILNLENVRVRGVRSITIHVLAAFIAMLAVAFAAKGKGLTKHIRCIGSIFGNNLITTILICTSV